MSIIPIGSVAVRRCTVEDYVYVSMLSCFGGFNYAPDNVADLWREMREECKVILWRFLRSVHKFLFSIYFWVFNRQTKEPFVQIAPLMSQ